MKSNFNFFLVRLKRLCVTLLLISMIISVLPNSIFSRQAAQWKGQCSTRGPGRDGTDVWMCHIGQCWAPCKIDGLDGVCVQAFACLFRMSGDVCSNGHLKCPCCD